MKLIINKIISFFQKLPFAYIRKIKKRMLCPNCKQDYLSIDIKSNTWCCNNCEYTLSVEDFENDYTFWFCDNCNSLLNNQKDFGKNYPIHMCENCGYFNGLTSINIEK